jgi:hypothetical protein
MIGFTAAMALEPQLCVANSRMDATMVRFMPNDCMEHEKALERVTVASDLHNHGLSWNHAWDVGCMVADLLFDKEEK